MNQLFWERLREFGRSVHLESVSIGFATVGFERVQVRTPSFSAISGQLAKPAGKSRDVFVVSAHNVDEVTVVDRIDADHECEALQTPLRCAGGSGANTAYALAQLGASVSISGAIGEDPDGMFLKNELCGAGVDVEMLLTTPQLPTGRTTTLVESGGKRFIVVHPGANNQFARLANERDLLRAALSSKIVHLSSFVETEELELQQRLVQDIGSQSLISFTPGALYAKQGLDRLGSILRHVDVMFLYREQLAQLVKNSSVGGTARGEGKIDLLHALFSWRKQNKFDSPLIVVIKDPLGSISTRIQEQFLTVAVGCQSLETTFGPQPSFRGTDVRAVDLTGSGDAAAAGFLYRLLQGADLKACIDLSFVMASIMSTELGARSALRSASAHMQRTYPKH